MAGRKNTAPSVELQTSVAKGELFDPRSGDPSLVVESLCETGSTSINQRLNCFSIRWIQKGSGQFWADTASYSFGPGSLLFFNPYQAFRIIPETPAEGLFIQFHANFLCIETYQEEIGCNGVLFNDVYGSPLVQLDREHEQSFAATIQEMQSEIRSSGLAHVELLVSYLKILLVKATRLKLQQQRIEPQREGRTPTVLEDLRRLIETHYRTKHAPSEYADLLHLAPKSLAKIVKTHLRKTLTALIRERLLKQAKWEMLHTLKPVKQVAAELGFDDELYFSRLFKRSAGMSPSAFREFETAIRNGSNVAPHFLDRAAP